MAMPADPPASPTTPRTPVAGDADLTRIGQIAIVVRDVDRAVRFYRDTLGLRFLFQPSPGLAFFECGGVRLMLSRAEGEGLEAGTSILYYVVDDIQRAYTALSARGVRFVTEPRVIARMPDHDLWMAGCRDSEENLLELMSEVRR
jgi:catechol 2,3-dioxygenase-like lactoylglutathione lyase family enzyme